MQSLCGSIRLLRRHATNSLKILEFERDVRPFGDLIGRSNGFFCHTPQNFTLRSLPLASTKPGSAMDCNICSASLLSINRHPSPFQKTIALQNLWSRCISTEGSGDSPVQHTPLCSDSPRVKFKRLDKTSRYIMQILDKEAVEEVRAQREIPDIQPGHIIQLKVEVPENKRRVSTLKGIVIARRNAGINTTFRLRRLVAGVGIESLFMLYSPSIKEIKVLDKKKVRRAKLYYLRDRMNPLKK